MFRLMVVLLLSLPLVAVNATPTLDNMVNGAVDSHFISAHKGAGQNKTSSYGNVANWPLLTQKDLTAIYQILKFEYASKLNVAGDKRLTEQIKRGYQQALDATIDVSNHVQYLAVLNSYAAMFDGLKVVASRFSSDGAIWWAGAITTFKHGYWIDVAFHDVSFLDGGKNTEKTDLLAGLEHFQKQIERSPYMVLDLRGDLGDNFNYADQVAQALFGKHYALASQGDSFPLYQGQIVILTDDDCFGPCLRFTELFLGLGAIHVGRTTASMRGYFDAKQRNLPSGLSAIYVQSDKGNHEANQLGPFKPRYTYSDDINETLALKSWVLGLLSADRD